MRTQSSLVTVFVVGSALSVIASACGSSSGSSGFGSGTGDDGGAGGDSTTPVFGDSGFNQGDGSSSSDSATDPDAFWAMDPPFMTCGPDGSVDIDAAPPGGTVECPDDKNRQGCPCPTEGATAACWPGLRSERNVGVCKDGVTTCEPSGELANAWGPCVGYHLPDEGATMGADACKCFSTGQWAIADLSPCFWNNGAAGASSTVTTGGVVACPDSSMPPPDVPTSPWSTDTVTADCVGTFTLCYTLKAGSATTPQPTDCTVAQVCTTSYYPVAGQVTTFPDLPAWATTSSQTACATQFATSGGYGEMSVTGESELCEAIGDVNDAGVQTPFVFNRVTYCPSSCNSNPSGAGCANCMSGGGGTF